MSNRTIIVAPMESRPASTEAGTTVPDCFVPPRIGSRYIPRTDLLKKLWRDRHAKLTLVTGSPGFGKTSLLAQWRQELMKQGSRICWLSLSIDEDGLASFAAHCLAALEQLGLQLDEDLLLISEGTGQIDRAIAAIVNALATQDEDLYLLIDDYHCIQDPRAHQFLQKLIDHNPGNLHVTLASRAMPPLSLAKLRVMGQVAEIECADLPFSLTETRSFLRHSLGSAKLSASQSMEIHDLTNGWPASLQLLSIMLKQKPAGEIDIAQMDWESSDLHSYLTKEVVGSLSPDVAEFMEILSLCRRFNTSLAYAMTGRGDAEAMIARIEQDNLLLVRDESNDHEPWFHFHPMLNDFLKARLTRHPAAVIQGFHRHASRWFDAHDMVVEAIGHAAQGDDPAFAASVAQRVTPDMWRLSQMGALHRLVNALPLSAIAPYPKLVYFCSITLAFVGASAQAAALDAYFPEQQDATDRFHRTLLQATIALRRDDTDRALGLVDGLAVPEEASSFERHLIIGAQTIALAGAARFDEAYALVDRYEAQLHEPHDGMALMALDGRAMALLLQGRVAEALPLLEDLYRHSLTHDRRRSASADLLGVNIAYALCELNRLDEARDMLANRQQNIQRAFAQFMIFASLAEARLERRLSNKGALAVVETHLETFRSFGLDRGIANLLLLRLEIEIEERSTNAARATIRQLSEVQKRNANPKGIFAEIGIIGHCARARLALFDQHIDAARDEADAAWTLAEAMDHRRWLVTLDLLQARIAEAGGDLDRSQEHFERALFRGQSLGLVRTFLDEGQAAARLLGKIEPTRKRNTDTIAYIEMLLSAFEHDQPAAPLVQTGSEDASPLSPREEEIIRLLAANMSNKRIASTIGISIETVKWNLKNIFQKLGVSSRYHAVTWARRHGLID